MRTHAVLGALTLTFVLGCTKKSTPAFESAVKEWETRACACLHRDDVTGCTADRPEAELSYIEQTLANAGLLTDNRRPVVERAETLIQACGEGALREKEARRVKDEQDGVHRALKNVDLKRALDNAGVPAALGTRKRSP